jgi:hypothetical protein
MYRTLRPKKKKKNAHLQGGTFYRVPYRSLSYPAVTRSPYRSTLVVTGFRARRGVRVRLPSCAPPAPAPRAVILWRLAPRARTTIHRRHSIRVQPHKDVGDSDHTLIRASRPKVHTCDTAPHAVLYPGCWSAAPAVACPTAVHVNQVRSVPRMLTRPHMGHLPLRKSAAVHPHSSVLIQAVLRRCRHVTSTLCGSGPTRESRRIFLVEFVVRFLHNKLHLLRVWGICIAAQGRGLVKKGRYETDKQEAYAGWRRVLVPDADVDQHRDHFADVSDDCEMGGRDLGAAEEGKVRHGDTENARDAEGAARLPRPCERHQRVRLGGRREAACY